MYLLSFYIPSEYSEKVKSSLFSAGAGKYRNYDSCCWETEGTGQFRPLNNSKPFIGNHGEIKSVKELKIEMICEDEFLQKAIEELKKNHPYEEPAYHFIRISL